MKRKTVITVMFLSFIFTFWSCRKSDKFEIISLSSINDYASIVKEISDARIFFEANFINKKTAQKFNKQPKWDNAYITHFNNGDKVTVPLDYEKHFTFKASTNPTRSFELKKQSHLYIYINANGDYQYEVVTTIPDAFTNGNNKSFNGLIVLSDWHDNVIGINKYKNGVEVPIKHKNNTFGYRTSSLDDETVCLDYYWCPEGWYTLTDCYFMFSDCSSNSGGSNGSGGYAVSEAKTSAPQTWMFGYGLNSQEDTVYKVKSIEVISGVKESNGNTYITGISQHKSEIFDNLSGWSWTELIYSPVLGTNGATITSFVEGKAILLGGSNTQKSGNKTFDPSVFQ